MSDIQAITSSVNAPVAGNGLAGNQESVATERRAVQETAQETAPPASSPTEEGVGDRVDIKA